MLRTGTDSEAFAGDRKEGPFCKQPLAEATGAADARESPERYYQMAYLIDLVSCIDLAENFETCCLRANLRIDAHEIWNVNDSIDRLSLMDEYINWV